MIKYTKYLQASLKTICNISVERSSPHRIKMYHKNPAAFDSSNAAGVHY